MAEILFDYDRNKIEQTYSYYERAAVTEYDPRCGFWIFLQNINQI